MPTIILSVVLFLAQEIDLEDAINALIQYIQITNERIAALEAQVEDLQNRVAILEGNEEPPPPGILEDEFDNDLEQWNFINPNNAANATVQNGHATITVNGPHDLWIVENKTARLIQSVSEPFDIKTKLNTSLEEGAMLGIHLQGKNGWLRTEVQKRNNDLRVFSIPLLDGQFGQITQFIGSFPYLRARYDGSAITTYASQDGERWMMLHQIQTTITEVGLYVGISNGSNLTSFTGKFDWFRHHTPDEGALGPFAPIRPQIKELIKNKNAYKGLPSSKEWIKIERTLNGG